MIIALNRGAQASWFRLCCITILLLIGNSNVTSSQTGQQSDTLWTNQHRGALIYLEMQGRKGTGFLVRSEAGRLYAITAAHNLFGVTNPNTPSTAGGSTSSARPQVPIGECLPVGESDILLRVGDIGGTPIYADCVYYLGGPDIGAVRIKSPGRILPVLSIGRFASMAHRNLSFLGFRAGLPLGETPAPAVLDTTAGPENSILFYAPNAGGFSGAPYMSGQAVVVGVHSGNLTDSQPRPGFTAMVPLTAVGDVLARLGLPLDAPDAGASHTVIWGAVGVVDIRTPTPRAASPEEAFVQVYFVNERGRGPARDLPLQPGGTFVLGCPDGAQPARRAVVYPRASVQSGTFVPIDGTFDCDRAPPSADISFAASASGNRVILTERSRYIADELRAVEEAWALLLPRLPSCLRTFKTPTIAMQCAVTNSAQLQSVSENLDEIDNQLATLIARSIGDSSRRAAAEYARHKIRLGRPCDGSDEMIGAIPTSSDTASTQIIRQLVVEWADAVVACATQQANPTRFGGERPDAGAEQSAAEDAYSATLQLIDRLPPNTFMTVRPRIIRLWLEITAILNPGGASMSLERRISSSSSLLSSWGQFATHIASTRCPNFPLTVTRRSISQQYERLLSGCT